MKKSRLMYAIILCLAGAVQSCAEIEVLQEDSAEISVTNGFQVVTSSSTSAAFEVKSNSEWKVVCNADWISDYTKKGSGDGVVTVFGEYGFRKGTLGHICHHGGQEIPLRDARADKARL